MADVAHVVPIGDLVEHDFSTDDATCVCGPTTKLVDTDHGDGWILVHHALDGRT